MRAQCLLQRNEQGQSPATQILMQWRHQQSLLNPGQSGTLLFLAKMKTTCHSKQMRMSIDKDTPTPEEREWSPSIEEVEPPEETAKTELSMLFIDRCLLITRTHEPPTDRLQKDWTSLVYAFFDPIPTIQVIDGCRIHKFRCSAHGCKARIRRYLDTKDARSTGNMRKHVRSCWGEDVLSAAQDAKDVTEVWMKIIGSILCNGSITAAFERKNKGQVTYSNHQHTWAKTRYVLPF